MTRRRGVIVFDLDGTLIDVRTRYWTLHSRLCDDLGLNPLSKSEYWRLKRSGLGLKQMFPGWPEGGRLGYAARWLDEIERPELLTLDALLPAADEVLKSLPRRSVVIATLRRHERSARAQVRHLGLDRCVAGVLISGTSSRSKSDLLRQLPAESVSDIAAVVGDTEDDIAGARAVGAVAVAVETGLRDRNFLLERGAWVVIPGVSQLPAVLAMLENSAAFRLAARDA